MLRLPLLLLSTSLLVSPVRRFVPAEQACDELITDMYERYNEGSRENTVNHTFAVKFHSDCQLFQECLKQNYPPQKVDSDCCDLTGDRTYEDFLRSTCRISEILAGPLGPCFDYVKFDYNKTKLISCFLDRVGKDFKSKIVDLMIDVTLDVTGCDPTYNKCVKDIIELHCEPEAYQLYQSKEKTLMATRCAGAQMFVQRDYDLFKNRWP